MYIMFSFVNHHKINELRYYSFTISHWIDYFAAGNKIGITNKENLRKPNQN